MKAIFGQAYAAFRVHMVAMRVQYASDNVTTQLHWLTSEHFGTSAFWDKGCVSVSKTCCAGMDVPCIMSTPGSWNLLPGPHKPPSSEFPISLSKHDLFLVNLC